MNIDGIELRKNAKMSRVLFISRISGPSTPVLYSALYSNHLSKR